MDMRTQREMPFHQVLTAPKFVPQKVVDGFVDYRDAVIWCWANRVCQGAGKQADQAMCANSIGMQTPKFSRCVNRDTNAPMKLDPDFIASFENFCGHTAVSQFLARQRQFTILEQVMEERRMSA